MSKFVLHAACNRHCHRGLQVFNCQHAARRLGVSLEATSTAVSARCLTSSPGLYTVPGELRDLLPSTDAPPPHRVLENNARAVLDVRRWGRGQALSDRYTIPPAAAYVPCRVRSSLTVWYSPAPRSNSAVIAAQMCWCLSALKWCAFNNGNTAAPRAEFRHRTEDCLLGLDVFDASTC